MKAPSIINVRGWIQSPHQAGGTRDKVVLQRSKDGKVYFIVKNALRYSGELRAEVCASNVGKLLGFPVQRAQLCKIPQYQKLGLAQKEGIVAQMDVRRRRYKQRKQYKEELVHAADIIADIDPRYRQQDIAQGRRDYTLELVVRALRRYAQKLNPRAKKMLWQGFFELTVFDSIIGGTDRHERNWGVVVRASSREFIRTAHAFDNGVSLLWKGEEDFRRFARNGLTDRYINRARSAFRKDGGGKRTLFKVVQEVGSLAEIRETRIVPDLFGRIVSISDTRLRHAIVDFVPHSEAFDTSEKALLYTYNYCRLRLRKTRSVLQGLRN